MTGSRVKWRRGGRSAAAASLAGAPNHSANDPIINPGDSAVVQGKFAYGTVSKDLEGEEVGLWLRMGRCGAWKEIRRAVTDDDGRLAIEVSHQYFSGPGAYPYQFIVRGDLSRVSGTIYVLDRNTPVVIFDVDGTLTTSDSELLEQVALGRDPEVRPGASQVANYYATASYLPIYVSGRPYLLRRSTAAWLRRHGFPPGPLVTTDAITDAAPTQSGVGRFKYNTLARLVDDVGLHVIAAYGNADTDVCVYSSIGLPPEKTFIVSDQPRQCPPHPPVQTIDSYIEHYRVLGQEGTR